eukprot:GCRY01003679.1.p1 GENE.GCRY01003679.1~~GCRY01003679.1.p1  ORF type:complete len:497 (-),score=102.42 GCRY01003679.1:202-1692(-)
MSNNGFNSTNDISIENRITIIECLLKINGVSDVIHSSSLWTTQAVFSALPSLAQHVVMRLLFLSVPVTLAMVHSWFSNAMRVNHTLKQLSSLHIILTRTKPGPGSKEHLTLIRLNPSFESLCQQAIVNTVDPWDYTSEEEARGFVPDEEFLTEYATVKWESLQHILAGTYMGDSLGRRAPPPPATLNLLLNAGLLQSSSTTPVGPKNYRDLAITNKGFQFLLQDQGSQVWAFLIHYLSFLQRSTKVEVLGQAVDTIFRLGACALGKPYQMGRLNQNVRKIIEDFSAFGLVCIESVHFFTTPLCRAITGSLFTNLSLAGDEQKLGYLIVQTNYTVIAYTTSPLKTAIIGLFTDIKYRMPNMAMGSLTRESVSRALKKGISAEQMIRYLRLNAHPVMRGKGPALPPTICEQLQLWERERSRVNAVPGVLLSHFSSGAEFEHVVKYAKAKNVLIWADQKRGTAVIRQNGYTLIAEFIREMQSKQKEKSKDSLISASNFL